MRLIRRKNAFPAIVTFAAWAAFGAHAGAAAAAGACPGEQSGLTLPTGFCATIFADDIGHARHLVVAANGVRLCQYMVGVYFGNDVPHAVDSWSFPANTKRKRQSGCDPALW